MNILFFSQNSIQQGLSVNLTELEAFASASSHNVTVTISPLGSLPVISDNRDWITTSYDNATKTLTVNLTENTTGSYRSGIIALTHPYNTEIKAYISVTQES